MKKKYIFILIFNFFIPKLYSQQPAYAGEDATICTSSYTLQGNAPNPGNTGLWTSSNPTVSFNNAALYNAKVLNLPKGSITLKWSITENSITSEDDVIITNNQPTAYAGSDLYTYTDNTVLNAMPAALGTGTWSLVQGSGSISDVNDYQATVSNLTEGKNTLQWTVNYLTCSASDQLNIYYIKETEIDCISPLSIKYPETSPYQNNTEYFITYKATETSKSLQVNFTSFKTESNSDLLKIYNSAYNEINSGNLLGTYSGTSLPPTITSSGRYLTFVFTSNSTITAAGWEGTVECIDNVNYQTKEVTCGSPETFCYPKDCSSDYEENEEYTIVYKSLSPSMQLKIEFTKFDLENNYDYLYVYNGDSENAPLLAQLTGQTIPADIISTGEYLTLKFKSDYINNYKGISANITCATKPAEPVLASDSLALIDLYNSMGGTDWDYVWDTGLPVNTWYGVEITSTGTKYEVTSIALPANNISGSIPTQLGQLKSLKKLNLRSNKLSGNIPKELFNATNMEELDLSNNNLSNTIPPEIFNCPSLIKIDLSYNNLSGTIPEEMMQITLLEALNLSHNKFSGSIPTPSSPLLLLKNLKLNNNQLTGSIPDNIGDFFSLQILMLNDNKLSGSIPANINQLNQMEILNFSNNQLEGAFPEGLNNLNLSLLNLASNKLYGTISKLEFDNILYVDLSNNEFDGFNEIDPKKIPNIQRLTISQNNLTFEDIEKNLDLTGLLYAPQNNTDEKITVTLTETENYKLSTDVQGSASKYLWFKDNDSIANSNTQEYQLTDVSLSDSGIYYCQITDDSVPDLTLRRQTIKINIKPVPANMNDSLALIALYNSTNGDKWGNKWDLKKSIYSWQGVSLKKGRVIYLELPSNNLNGFIPNEIGNLDSLELLNLSSNNLSDTLPVSIGNLKNLKSLVLNNNRLSGNIPTEIGQLSLLKQLFFDNNYFTGAIPQTIGNLSNLEYLNLSINLLSDSLPSEINQLTNLKELMIYNTKISGFIPDISALNQLTTLRLGDNYLSGNIPGTIGQLTDLTQLDLSNNYFSGNLPTQIFNLTKLSLLDLSLNNSLSGSIATEIANLTELIYLNLSENQFTGDFPSGINSCKKLTQLNLSKNSFSGNFPSIVNLIYLKELDISNNLFDNCANANLETLFNLKTINLSHNLFTGIPDFQLLIQNGFISNVDVSENQLDFGDLEPNIQIPNFIYSPQNKVDTSKIFSIQEGGDTTLTITVGGSDNLYQWYKNDEKITNQTAVDILIQNATIDDKGTYICKVTNPDFPQLTLERQPIYLLIGQDLNAPKIDVPAPYCIGDTIINLSSTQTSGNIQTHWYADSDLTQLIGTGDIFRYSLNESRKMIYAVNYLDNIPSPAVEIPLILKPQITKQSTNLSVIDDADNYFWYKDGTLISEGSATCLIEGIGTYYVKVSSGFCTATSDNYQIKNKKRETINVYPNPFNQYFSVTVLGKEKEDVTLRIYNMLGEIVYDQKFNDVENKFTKELQLNNDFNVGVYFLVIQTTQNKIIKKIIKR